VRRISLSQGKYTIVDDDDYLNLIAFKWYYSHGYAVRHPKMVRGYRRGKISIHREILHTPKGKLTDHINGNTLDNRKSNLRIVDIYKNGWNQKILKNTPSGFKDIYWRKTDKAWEVRVMEHGKRHSVGYFKNKDDAVDALLRALKKYHQGYANRRI